VKLEKGKLVPVAALENDLAADDMKEATSSQTFRIAPLQNRPLPILEDVLDDADHLCSGKSIREHLTNGLAAFDRFLCNLMVELSS
jgi:hypothetical protein